MANQFLPSDSPGDHEDGVQTQVKVWKLRSSENVVKCWVIVPVVLLIVLPTIMIWTIIVIGMGFSMPSKPSPIRNINRGGHVGARYDRSFRL